MSAIIDTGVLFAHLHRDDRRHAEAQAIVEEILEGKYGLAYIADGVVQELFTLIRARTGDAKVEGNAFQLLFGDTAFATRVRFLPSGGDIHREAYRIFERARDQRISFVDACQLALKDDLQLQHLLTFDGPLARLATAPS